MTNEKELKRLLAKRLMGFVVRLNKIRLGLKIIEDDIFSEAAMWLDKTPKELETLKTSHNSSSKKDCYVICGKCWMNHQIQKDCPDCNGKGVIRSPS